MVKTLLRRRTLRIFALLLALSATPLVHAQTYDIVIRNGHVLDGAGNPWIAADVAIQDGKFVKIEQGHRPWSPRD